MVTVRIPNVLRRYTAQVEFVEVEALTIDSALRSLVSEYPDLGTRIFDDTENLHPQLMVFHRDLAVSREDWTSTSVTGEDQITVRVAISGGA